MRTTVSSLSQRSGGEARAEVRSAGRRAGELVARKLCASAGPFSLHLGHLASSAPPAAPFSRSLHSRLSPYPPPPPRSPWSTFATSRPTPSSTPTRSTSSAPVSLHSSSSTRTDIGCLSVHPTLRRRLALGARSVSRAWTAARRIVPPRLPPRPVALALLEPPCPPHFGLAP